MAWWRFKDPLDPRACVLTFHDPTRFVVGKVGHALPWSATGWTKILHSLSTGDPGAKALQAWGHGLGQVVGPHLGGARQLVIRCLPRADDALRLPWELVLDAGLPLRLKPGGAVLRQVVCEPLLPAPGDAGCALLAWAGNVPWKHHTETLSLALRKVGGVLEVLDEVDLHRLRRRLGDTLRPVRMLHILAHGVPGDPWRLALHGEDVTAVDLAAVLGHRALSLVCLVACQHASDPSGLFGVPLATLARTGVGPVVGSQYEFSVDGAKRAFDGFYEKLLEGRSIVGALSGACQDLHANRYHLLRPDWAGLVLVTPTLGKG